MPGECYLVITLVVYCIEAGVYNVVIGHFIKGCVMKAYIHVAILAALFTRLVMLETILNPVNM